MTTEELITALFYEVDEQLPALPKHPEAHLWPSEVITLGLLRALKGVGNRPFSRGLTRDYRAWFPRLPERTRLFRLFTTHQDWTQAFLAAPTVLGVIDTYGIELIHPIREGRSQFCRKVRFLGQNPKIGYEEFNDLQTLALSKKQLCDSTPARTHTVKRLRCAPICSADGCAALDRVRFVAGVKVSAPEGCQPSCLTRGMQGGHRPKESPEAMRFHVVDTIRFLHAVRAVPIP
jgi:hypothetical protein